jgi:hypothetical protein
VNAKKRAELEERLAKLQTLYAAATPEDRKDYVSAMLEWAGADVTRVYIRVTGALGLAAVFVTQIPFERLEALSAPWTAALFGGLASLTAAALLYFVYVSRTHVARREIAQGLLSVSGRNPEKILLDVFARYRVWALGVANALFILGAVLLGLVLWQVVTEHVPPVK